MKKINLTKKILLLVTLTLTLSAFLFPVATSAQVLKLSDDLKANTQEFASESQLSDVEPNVLIASLIRTALSLLAVLFLILIIMAGFQWMTANGEEDKIKKAKSMLINAVIGLLIVIAAYTITYFVFTYLPINTSTKLQVA